MDQMKKRNIYTFDGYIETTLLRSKYSEENSVAGKNFCAHYFTASKYTQPLMIGDVVYHPSFYFRFSMVV